MPPMEKFQRLDVRPLLDRGIQPLQPILNRVKCLKSSDGLILVSPFLPSPLIELLHSQNIASKVEHGENGTWFIYFWRDASEET